MLQRCQDEVSQRLCIRPFCGACQKCAEHSRDAHNRPALPACNAPKPSWVMLGPVQTDLAGALMLKCLNFHCCGACMQALWADHVL